MRTLIALLLVCSMCSAEDYRISASTIPGFIQLEIKNPLDAFHVRADCVKMIQRRQDGGAILVCEVGGQRVVYETRMSVDQVARAMAGG